MHREGGRIGPLPAPSADGAFRRPPLFVIHRAPDPARNPRSGTLRPPPGLVELDVRAASFPRLPAARALVPRPLLGGFGHLHGALRPARLAGPPGDPGRGVREEPAGGFPKRGAARLIEAAFVFAYLALVLYIGIFAFRRETGTREDYFLASRSLGTFVFLLSL